MSEMSYDDLLTVRNSLIGILKKIDKEVQIDEDDTALEILDLIGENFGGESGYVEDVKISGSSIVENNVANIPVATETQITSRSNKHVITPSVTPHAVKSAITAPESATDPAYTQSEKALANERIGSMPATQWTMIVDKSYTGEGEDINIQLGENNYSQILVFVKFPAGSASTNGAIHFFKGNNEVERTAGDPVVRGETTKYLQASWKRYNGAWALSGFGYSGIGAMRRRGWFVGELFSNKNLINEQSETVDGVKIFGVTGTIEVLIYGR